MDIKIYFILYYMDLNKKINYVFKKLLNKPNTSIDLPYFQTQH